MHWIVDGYNVILSDRMLAKLFKASNELGREDLINTIMHSDMPKGERVTIVFDGKFASSEERVGSNVRVKFTSTGETADDVIKGEIARSTRRRSLRIVSDDNSISTYARECGAVAVGSKDFLSMLRGRGQGTDPATDLVDEKPAAGGSLDTELLKLFREEKK